MHLHPKSLLQLVSTVHLLYKLQYLTTKIGVQYLLLRVQSLLEKLSPSTNNNNNIFIELREIDKQSLRAMQCNAMDCVTADMTIPPANATHRKKHAQVDQYHSIPHLCNAISIQLQKLYLFILFLDN